ncbi:PINc/VapC family ATPase [Candidatus Nanohalovita haloferacivicina]|uniref:PINc/VapC family ATPase n=1 Tax=Candidatus Nanohalovita haloferacivicina TaxID=2978046 RepID=UPI00325FA618|nr:ATPase (PilT family) part of archaella system [Candidatus Nanohalobia archaeon BNXNv]
MSQKIVPDTSIIIDGKLSYLIEKGDIEGEIIIPEFVVDELENQANEGKETGYKGIDEIKEIRMLAEREGIGFQFKGRKPTTEEIEMAHAGRIDALIRDMAEEMGATLYTADRVQAKVARAKGIDVKEFEKERDVKFSLEDYFDDKTMSVHLKEGSTPKAKRGLPGEFELEEIGKDKLTKDKMYELINETIEKAEISDEGLVEMEEDGATVIQLGPYRIAMTRPPFSEAAEITAVRPVAKVSLDDYEMSEKLLNRLKTEAEGILVAGAPGHGKSTFSQALAEYYREQGQIVKTMEKPRDLDVSEDITQYTALDGSMENTGDFLLLARPDYTVFDEVRKTDDFEVFSDMRMAGVGMIGVVHASEAVDAVQRLIGRVELGMIPQVCDTVVFIRDAQIAEVYKIELTVKVPEGMTEEDLARPVIQISRFEDDSPQYEIYTYGEETVVVPVSEAAGGRKETGTQKLAKEQLNHYFKQYADNPRIEFLSDNHIQVEIAEDDIAHIIGKGGQNIDRIEDELGLNVTVEPKGQTLKSSTDYSVEERGNSVIIAVGEDMSGEEVDIYDDDEFLFAATVGKNGEISLTKQSDLAGRVLGAAERGSLKVRN